MKATLSAKLLLIAGIAIQSNAVNAQTETNNNTAESTEPVSATQPATNKLVDSTTNIEENLDDEFIGQNSALEQELGDQDTLEQLEKENAALDEMLEQSEGDEIVEVIVGDSESVEMIDSEVTVIESPETNEVVIVEETTDVIVTDTEAAIITPEGTEEVIIEDVTVIEESTELVVEENTAIDDVMSDLNESSDSTEGYQATEQENAAPYNFERTASGEAATFIPLMSDAKVFAEFIDRLPAVVNYFTMASEDEVINFYNDSFGEPIGQERKRERLTVSYYTDGIATRVVISQQDDYRQVDVIQEESN